MANTYSAMGLHPIAKLGQSTNSTGITGYTPYEIANGNTTPIYHGSPVIPLSTGYISLVGAAAGGTVSLLGAFVGCEYVSSTTSKPTWSNYWPGTGADSNYPVKAFVADDPNQLFVIGTDASWTSKATARAAVFANANFSSGTSGSTNTGRSTAALAISTIATTAALQLRIMGWVEDDSDSDFASAGIKAIVRLNNSFNSPEGSIAAGTPSTTGV
jgi:hypothetical protein